MSYWEQLSENVRQIVSWMLGAPNELSELGRWMIQPPWYEATLKITGGLAILGVIWRLILGLAAEEDWPPIVAPLLLVLSIAPWAGIVLLIVTAWQHLT